MHNNNVGVIMWEFYWEAIVDHRHDIMIPILIVYMIVDKYIDRWFWVKWLEDKFNK